MILYINVFITEEKLAIQTKYSYNRGNAKSFNKLDVYKFMLSSLAHFYPWKKVIINTKLDEYYETRRSELNNFIDEVFGHVQKRLIRNYRNERPIDYQKEFDNFDENLIFYLGAHDHIVVDYDYSYFHSIIDEFKNVDDFIAIPFTHWQELVSNFWTHLGNIIDYKIEDRYLSCKSLHTICTQIITKKVYHNWWFDKNIPDIIFRSSDNHPNDLINYIKLERMKWIIPYRELVRHFDGYGHCEFPFDNKACPALEIPEGYFEKNIRINYSFSKKSDMTNINPYSEKLNIFDQSGYDHNFSTKYMPYHWKSRISEFKDKMSKNYSIQNKMHIDRVLRCWDHIPTTNIYPGVRQIKNNIYKFYNN